MELTDKQKGKTQKGVRNLIDPSGVPGGKQETKRVKGKGGGWQKGHCEEEPMHRGIKSM